MSTFKDRVGQTLWFLYVPSFYFASIIYSLLIVDIISIIIFGNGEQFEKYLSERQDAPMLLKIYAWVYAPVYLFLSWLIFNKKDFLPKHISNASDDAKRGILVFIIIIFIALIYSNRI